MFISFYTRQKKRNGKRQPLVVRDGREDQVYTQNTKGVCISNYNLKTKDSITFPVTHCSSGA